ncbi:hypothetical protein FHX08_000009 [Rhizobium sp. BK529]|uniref:hypothetical protein n=1 Tax=Rhizobium sp. BK529 TaxID=2586983 RepID=UPI0016080647|nr:hypothetical protein [Rhizobium sp. BK529]MBB3589665.1 hypothetical protein [Rhizobium sp. BK529]
MASADAKAISALERTSDELFAWWVEKLAEQFAKDRYVATDLFAKQETPKLILAVNRRRNQFASSTA